MFIGMQDYTVGRYREMGERPEDVARKPKQQTTPSYEYRGREMGEKPWEVPTREQQTDYYQKATRETPSYQSRPTYETRPREIGETPADVARAEASQKANRPKTASEMTEQERRIDLYA